MKNIALTITVLFLLSTIVFSQEDKSDNQLVIQSIKAGSQAKEDNANRLLVRPSSTDFNSLILSTSGAGYQSRYIVNQRGEIICDFFCQGSEYIFKGKIYMWGHIFDSDPNYPLTFKLVKNTGFVYLCGRGIVTFEDGSKVRLGYGQKIDDWIAALKDPDELKRQGAVQAIGWLAESIEERYKSIQLLIVLLNDPVMEVRRNSAEVLGKIGNKSAKESLNVAVRDTNKWVRDVADESLALIDIRAASKVDILVDKLKHNSVLVRRTAADAIGMIGDKRALSALKDALKKEEDMGVKKAMEEVVEKLQK